MLLKNKVAVIYGAGGAIGGAVARAFALEGAKLFLTGRQRAPLGVVAKEILSAGGSAEVAEVDALDEKAVDNHLQFAMDKAGRVDISFNAIDVPIEKVAGAPLTEMDAEKFFLPIANYTRSYFLTARLAARRMVQNKFRGYHDGHRAYLAQGPSGERGVWFVAGCQGSAYPRPIRRTRAHGIRVVGLRATGMESSPNSRNLRRSTISLSAPAGIASRNIGRLVATWTSDTVRGLESRLVMSQPEAAVDIQPPMFDTTVPIQMIVNVL